jgi:hypothetical protein
MGRTILHHCFTGAGGRKDDAYVIPLCETHHVSPHVGIHGIGRKCWQFIYGSEAMLIERRDLWLSE